MFNWLWWILSLVAVFWINIALLLDYDEEFNLSMNGDVFTNDHFDALFPDWQVLYPARLQVTFAAMMLLSHALVDGGLTITQRTNANPSNSFSFGVIHASLGELKFDGVPLHFLQVLYFFSNPMTGPSPRSRSFRGSFSTSTPAALSSASVFLALAATRSCSCFRQRGLSET